MLRSVNTSELLFDVLANPVASVELHQLTNLRGEPSPRRLAGLQLKQAQAPDDLNRVQYSMRLPKLPDAELGVYQLIARNAVNVTVAELRLQSEHFYRTD